MSILGFLKKEFADLYRFRWVTLTVVQNNMKLRYKRSVLGFFWSLIGPMVSYGTMATVFYFGLKQRNENYFQYFFSGVVLFSFINIGISNSTNSIHGNESFIKKIYLPKSIYVLNTVLTETMTFMFNFIAVTLLGVLIGQITLTPKIFLFPLLAFPAFLFIFGFGLIFSIGAVFFRDVTHAIPLFLQASFYLTPILYRREVMPLKFQWLIDLNPLSHYVELFRWSFMDVEFPLSHLNFALCWSFFGMFFGFILLNKFDNKLVFKL